MSRVLPSVDADTLQFRDEVRDRIAANLVDPETLEGAALAAAFAATDPATNLFSPAVMTALDDALEQTNVENYTYAPMSKWFAAKARAQAGTANARVLCVGDSKTWGYPLRPSSAWPALMAPRLNLGASAPAAELPGTEYGLDAAWTYATPWQLQYGAANRMLFSADGNNALATYKPTYVTDTVDVWYWKGADKGTVTVTINGTATAVNMRVSDGSSGWVKTTLAMTRGTTNTISLGPVAGGYANVFLDAYDSTTKSVRIANWGISGATTLGWFSSTYSMNAIQNWSPDLTIFQLGTNDAQAGTSVADWKNAMSALIDAAKISGDVVLLSCVQSQPANVAGLEQAYRDAMPALAAAKDVVFIDVLEKAGPWQSQLFADTLHPNTRGQANVARIIAAGLRDL